MPDTASVTISDMASAADADAFRTLNEAWIERFFTLEDEDRKLLGDPVGQIVEPGGAVFVARMDDAVVGCVGIMPVGDGEYELVKMAVAADHQGHGTGRRLIQYAIDRARAVGARRLVLETNSALASAVHLYETTGFRHLGPEERHASPYVRADVAMALEL
ncbi:MULTISPECIES: GNAT family N-acetyltransferase [unclassified Curtobacterium]|uniref:GNAT family N-acetyltransferase n=1 Tax=unclassified Curtobacterium TaxID=257496 RepID=UPI000F4B55FF|nr:MULTISPECIES: GNAT family N-acetyltransferase [unclassified Curtobacterium]ROP64672.1 acetyltransferase (GNAT) family protein [Curtobacterium sp. ZW137]TCK63586.1 acetyltransferase (GNAT) family protein [Curtobacterium sp. PhB136]